MEAFFIENWDTILIILAYIVGQIIVGKFLKEKISSLRTQIDTLKAQIESQKDMISNVKKFMDISESAVKQTQEASQAIERKSAIEQEEMIKKLKELEEFKDIKAPEAIKVLLNEYGSLLGFAFEVSFRSRLDPSEVEGIINKMKDSIAKERLLEVIADAKNADNSFTQYLIKYSLEKQSKANE